MDAIFLRGTISLAGPRQVTKNVMTGVHLFLNVEDGLTAEIQITVGSRKSLIYIVVTVACGLQQRRIKQYKLGQAVSQFRLRLIINLLVSRFNFITSRLIRFWILI